MSFIAIGDSSTKSTVPVAAIAANSITESEILLKEPAFVRDILLQVRYLGLKSPVFNDNSSKRLIDVEGKTITCFGINKHITLYRFLMSLTTILEYDLTINPTIIWLILEI